MKPLYFYIYIDSYFLRIERLLLLTKLIPLKCKGYIIEDKK